MIKMYITEEVVISSTKKERRHENVFSLLKQNSQTLSEAKAKATGRKYIPDEENYAKQNIKFPISSHEKYFEMIYYSKRDCIRRQD